MVSHFLDVGQLYGLRRSWSQVETSSSSSFQSGDCDSDEVITITLLLSSGMGQYVPFVVLYSVCPLLRLTRTLDTSQNGGLTAVRCSPRLLRIRRKERKNSKTENHPKKKKKKKKRGGGIIANLKRKWVVTTRLYASYRQQVRN